MRIAGVQAASAYLDRKGSIDKVLAAMGDASQGGADLVAFPETFVPGYPWWVDIATSAAVFDDPQSPETNVLFPTEGTYVLKLTADDGAFVVVRCQPAGSDQQNLQGVVDILQRSNASASQPGRFESCLCGVVRIV